jgi:hypothetical protein
MNLYRASTPCVCTKDNNTTVFSSGLKDRGTVYPAVSLTKSPESKLNGSKHTPLDPDIH